MLGIKQEALAMELGEDWSQKKISMLEQKESIEPGLLEQVARALKVPREAIENFDEEKALNIISNTFHEAAFINSSGTFNVNPVEKWLQALDEVKSLYERLLQSEREKVEMLSRIVEGKKD